MKFWLWEIVLIVLIDAAFAALMGWALVYLAVHAWRGFAKWARRGSSERSNAPRQLDRW